MSGVAVILLATENSFGRTTPFTKLFWNCFWRRFVNSPRSVASAICGQTPFRLETVRPKYCFVRILSNLILSNACPCLPEARFSRTNRPGDLLARRRKGPKAPFSGSSAVGRLSFLPEFGRKASGIGAGEVTERQPDVRHRRGQRPPDGEPSP